MKKSTWNEGVQGMRKLLSLAALFVLLTPSAIPGTVTSARRGSNPDPAARDQFVGAWRLAWLEEPSADGKVQRVDCTGLLVYTRDGHVAVQVMYRNPQENNGVAPAQYVQGGYEAFFGTYEVGERAHDFTFHVEGALVRSLVGKDMKRVYEISGNQLIVKSADPNERWRASWERY